MQTSTMLRSTTSTSSATSHSTQRCFRTLRLPKGVSRAPRNVTVYARGSQQTKKKPAIPQVFTLGFTKGNELFVGRMAMIGFASSLIGEVLTGKGALAQLGYETKLPTFEVDWIIGGLIAFNAIAAILPTSGTFVPEERAALKSRPKGSLQDPSISLFDGKKFFGLKGGFGFSKENEIFVGRTAQLGFAASLLGEVLTGKGPLAQFGLETGIPLQDAEFGLLVFIAFFVLAAINEGSGSFQYDNDETY